MKYQFIIFDADETLFDFRKSEQVALQQAMEDFHAAYQEELHLPIYQEINAAIWKELEAGAITQKELKIERFHRFFKKMGWELDQDSFAKQYMHHLAHASFLYDGVQAFIEALHHQARLAIVTNGLTAVQSIRVKQSEIAHCFESIVISEEAGVSKPDPRIFELAAGGIDKSSILMVGDSLSSDIAGGIRYGIDTCWYNPNQLVNHTDIHPTYEIQSLTELQHLLSE